MNANNRRKTILKMMTYRFDMKAILDPCCGSRMFYFDKKHPAVIFGDKRAEQHTLCDGRTLNIEPDVELDFTALPYDDEQFHLVVFDPPHLIHAGTESWLAKKYGVLNQEWQTDIKAGFTECWRVLKQNGTLIFKWNEYQVPVSEVVKLAPAKPIFGNRRPKQSKTHWLVFMKLCEGEI